MTSFLDRLFPKKKISLDAQTIPLSAEQLKTVSREEKPLSPSQLVVGCSQSVGLQREQNEDAIFSLNAVLADGKIGTNLGLFIVADGMGGHQFGEIASGVAARTLAEHVIFRIFIPFLSLDNPGQQESLQEVMENGINEAQKLVLKQAPGGGTTITAALVIGDQVTVAHVGDSRAYFISPGGKIDVITQDHSLVRRLQDLGQITEKEASIHPQRNVLYRALGQVEPFRPDIHTHPMPRPGHLLLCSDGLWGVVPKSEILRIVTSETSPGLACSRLVDAANAAGGPDNISVILVSYPL